MTTWNLNETSHHVFICNGASCMEKTAGAVVNAIRKEIAAHGADKIIHTTRTLCNGRCDDACVVVVYPEGNWYREVTPELGKGIVQACLANRGEAATMDSLVYTYEGKLTATGRSVEGYAKP